MRRIVVVLFALFFNCNVFARTEIHIRNQEDCDNILAVLISAIRTGEDEVRVSFSTGKYVVKDALFTLRGIDAPKTKLFFTYVYMIIEIVHTNTTRYGFISTYCFFEFIKFT